MSGVFTGEGGELLGGHSLREDRRSAGLAWFLKAWGAETLDTLTRGDGLSILLGRRVSMHAMVQPVLLRGLLIDPLAQGQGFLARCLVSEPGTLAGTRLFKAGNPAEAPAVKAYHAAMRHLLSMQARVNGHGDGYELQTRPLGPSVPAAKSVDRVLQPDRDRARQPARSCRVPEHSPARAQSTLPGSPGSSDRRKPGRHRSVGRDDDWRDSGCHVLHQRARSPDWRRA